MLRAVESVQHSFKKRLCQGNTRRRDKRDCIVYFFFFFIFIFFFDCRQLLVFFVCGLIKAVLGDLLRIKLTASASGDCKFPAAANWRRHGNVLLPLAMDSRWLGFRMSPGGGGLFFWREKKSDASPDSDLAGTADNTRVAEHHNERVPCPCKKHRHASVTLASRQRHASGPNDAPRIEFNGSVLLGFAMHQKPPTLSST